MNKTRVMIVDDQFTARQLFDLYIKQSERYETVRMVESASAVIAQLGLTRVDLILMDILMNDGSNGLDAAAAVKKLRPDVKIIAVTSMAEVSWLKRAREIGINSFWFKDAAKETILSVMDRTMAGESVYPDSPPLVRLGCAASNAFTERELGCSALHDEGNVERRHRKKARYVREHGKDAHSAYARQDRL